MEYDTYEEGMLKCLISIAESLSVIASALQPKTPKPEAKTTATKKFVKPTIDEIKEYIKEKGYDVDAERFFNFYESKGWVVGKSPMKNWKAAVSTWGKSSSEYPSNIPQPETQPETPEQTNDLFSDPQMMEILRMGRERYKNL